MKLLRTDTADLKVSEKNKQVAKVRINRTPEGIKVYFKSKVIADMFKEQSSGTYDTAFLNHIGESKNFLTYNSSSLTTEAQMEGGTIGINLGTSMTGNCNNIGWSWDYDKMTCCPNLAFLGFTEAGDGVTVSLNGIISNRQFDCYINSVNTYIEWLWQTFCVDKESETTITTAQVLKIKPRGKEE